MMTMFAWNTLAGLMIAIGTIFTFRVPTILDRSLADGKISQLFHKWRLFFRIGGVIMILCGIALFWVNTIIIPSIRD